MRPSRRAKVSRSKRRRERAFAASEKEVEGEFVARISLSLSLPAPSALLRTFSLTSICFFFLTSRNAWAWRGSAKVTKAKPRPDMMATSERAPNLEAYSPRASTVVPSGMPPMKSLQACGTFCVFVCLLVCLKLELGF